MRRIILGLVVALFFMGLAAMPAEAGPRTPIKCLTRHTTDYHTITRGVIARSQWKVFTEIRYRACQQKTTRGWRLWSDPMTVTHGCKDVTSSFGEVNWAHFNLYIWDRAGHSINPPDIRMRCKSSHYTERSFHLPDPNRFYKIGDHPPRWRTDGYLDFSHDRDSHFELASTMWGGLTPVPFRVQVATR